MPCQINILTVNGVIPIAGTQPTRLRVTGTAVQCQGVILTTTPNVTAPMTTPVTVDPNGRFLIDIPFTGAIACGDQLGVTVICAANTNCTATNSEALECCSVQIVSVDGIVPQGQLNPTAIRVTGSLYGCASDTVTISIPGVTAPRTVAVDPVLGGFNEQLPITATGIICDGPTPIQVIAECVNGPANCRDTWRGQLNCPQCFRATLSMTAGPCTGTPPNQVQPVTITAQISIPAGQTHDFVIDFGDGTTSAPFQINNAAGTGASVYTHVEPPHNYPPGTYTAELRIITASECPPVSITFTVTCNRCPQVTVSVVVGPCETSGSLAGARQVTYTIGFTPALGATDTAYANFSYGGTNLATGLSTGTAQRTGGSPITHTVYLAPGSYSSTVSLTIVDQGNVALCIPPLPPFTFTTRPPTAQPAVDVAACLPCPTSVKVAVGPGTPPLPAPHRQFEATVVWPNPTPPPPPPYPAAYDWTVTLPGGAQAKITNGPAIVTTQPSANWTWTGAGATPTGAVDLSQGGTYGVSVTAKYAPSAGLPVDPVTGVTSCNLTGPSNFPVTGTPPNCPTITAVSVTAGDCADETQNRPATIGFTASVQNPAAVSGPYQWDFGDPGSPSNVIQTTNPVAQHIYAAPGTYTVTVSLAATPNCPATSAQGTVTIGRCPCPQGQTRDSAGNCVPTDGDGDGRPTEDLGCSILRWVGVFLIALGLFVFVAWLCVGSKLPNWGYWLMLGIALGLILAGVLVLILWASICPVKPCLWGWLIAGQILLGFGLACLMLTGPPGAPCCPWMLWVGVIAAALGAAAFAIWIFRCAPSFCQVIIELAPVLSNVLAIIGIIAAVPVLSACVNGTIRAWVGGISAVLVMILAGCAASGTQTRTGPPVN